MHFSANIRRFPLLMSAVFYWTIIMHFSANNNERFPTGLIMLFSAKVHRFPGIGRQLFTSLLIRRSALVRHSKTPPYNLT